MTRAVDTLLRSGVDASGELLRSLAVEPSALEMARVKAALRENVLGRRESEMMLGRYRLQRFCGAGGHGTVYEAYDTVLGRRVALKLLSASSEIGDFQHRIKRLVEEAQLTASINDHRIVTLHDICIVDVVDQPRVSSQSQTAPEIAMIMEFVEGINLRRWIATSNATLPRRLAVLCECARGLVAAHSVGLVHGDIKPENIMVMGDGRVKILDFGTARVLRDKAHLSLSKNGISLANTGTSGYASPEQHFNGECSEQSDQYSFCATIYEVVSGKPWGHRSELLTDRSIALPRPARWLAPVLHRGLSTLAAERYSSMEALLRDLEVGLSRRTRRIKVAAYLGIAGSVAAMSASIAVGSNANRLEHSICADTQNDSSTDAERLRKLEIEIKSRLQPIEHIRWQKVMDRIEAHSRQWQLAALAVCSPVAGAHNQHERLPDEQRKQAQCLEEQKRRVNLWLDDVRENPSMHISAAERILPLIGAPEDCVAHSQGLIATTSKASQSCAAKDIRMLFELESGLSHPIPSDALDRFGKLKLRLGACSDPLFLHQTELTYGHYLSAFQKYAKARFVFEKVVRYAKLHDREGLRLRAEIALMRADFRDNRIKDVEAAIQRIRTDISGHSDRLGAELAAEFYHSAAAIRVKQAKYKDAAELALHASSLWENYWGRAHPKVMRARRGYAEILYKKRDFEAAREIALQALLDHASTDIATLPERARFERLLGTIAWRRGEYDDAIVHLTQSANLWVRIAGPENRHTYDKLRMVAAVRFAAGEVEAALREQEQLLPAVRAKFGDDARLTGTIALDMISSLTRLGRLEAADEVLPLALHALAMHTRDHDPGVGYTLMAQAELERARGKVHVASEMCRNIVSVWRSTYGEQHPKMSWAYTCVGMAELAGAASKPVAAQSLELARERFSPAVDDPVKLAKIEFLLAQAVVDSQAERALKLAQHSANTYRTRPGFHTREADAVHAWIENNFPPSDEKRR